MDCQDFSQAVACLGIIITACVLKKFSFLWIRNLSWLWWWRNNQWIDCCGGGHNILCIFHIFSSLICQNDALNFLRQKMSFTLLDNSNKKSKWTTFFQRIWIMLGTRVSWVWTIDIINIDHVSSAHAAGRIWTVLFLGLPTAESVLLRWVSCW